MRERAETYGVCAIALVIGVAAGPLVRARPVRPAAAAPTDQPSPQLVSSPPASPIASAFTQPTPIEPLVTAVSPAKDLTAPKLSRRDVVALAEECAPTEPAKVLTSIVDVESARHPLRIGVNGKDRAFLEPGTKEEAVRIAAGLIISGRNIDLGLAQINSANLPWLGLSVEEVLDPCLNLAAAGSLMAKGYKAALKISRPGQSILQTAYSLYNTGTPDRGMANGYVARLEAQARRSGDEAP